ncbi:hypothetical protein MYX77_00545 [Acidobacteriia bacterium AH_259_A11_L15]|nr:hypothetical protein [Acidobacteriia bacterium AH_259_A11_L15]
MTEYFKRLYSKEEEFLDKFGASAAAAAQILSGDWQPNYHCSDRARKNQSYFRSTGELTELTFESATVNHDSNAFSSVQIVLRSSTRTVTVRVNKVGVDLLAEKIVDRLDQNARPEDKR